jgi:hypothetical protein
MLAIRSLHLPLRHLHAQRPQPRQQTHVEQTATIVFSAILQGAFRAEKMLTAILQ